MKRVFTGLAAVTMAAASPAPAGELSRFEPVAGRAVCEGSSGYAAATGGRRLFLYRPEWLEAQKQRVADNPALARELRERADAILARAPYTPTDKTRLPPSGDRRDYYSMGPYWWPDPESSSGEPYVRRDGQVNPERDGEAFDLRRLQSFSDDVRSLGFAYAYLDDPAYAAKAAELLRTWFINPQTRMNPNFNFAQAVPGRADGRPEGIIDATRLQPVIEAIGLIGPAEVLSAQEHQAMQDWFADLAHWMLTSPNGRGERAKTNNHGIIYDLMLTHFTLFAGLDEAAFEVASRFPERRLSRQMDDQGRFPQELERTRSWHYSHLALGGALREAQLAECVGLDLWNWSGEADRSISAGLAFLGRFAGDVDAWPRSDLDLASARGQNRARREARENFRLAAWGLNDPGYAAIADNIMVKEDVDEDLWISRYGR